MRNLIKAFLLSAFLAGGSVAEPAPELEVLDTARIQQGQVRVETRIDVWEDGELARSSRYDVYVGTERRSLAFARSDREAGQKILMLDDQFWLFLPGSQRPIRITPMQKMLGEASTGDISSLRWQEDYRIVDRQQLQDEKLGLTLEAARRGLSYQRVELVVRRRDHAPLEADFYLTSGKLAKTAQFHTQGQGDNLRVTAMTLQDEVAGRQQTRIHYLNTEPMVIPERWFSPAFLARNNLD